MKISIENVIFDRFPDYRRFVVFVNGIDNSAEKNMEIEGKLKEIEKSIRSNPKLEDFKNHPRLLSWRNQFTALGLNPNQCMPSVVALVKRVRSGSDLPVINPLVAIMNIISLKYLLPCGGDDLDKVKGDLILGSASGMESYIPLGKPETVERPKQGEVIYYDDSSNDVLCRSWCWRNGDTTKILPSTKRAAINVDVIPPVPIGEGEEAAEELASLVESICGGKTHIYFLNNSYRTVNL